MAEKVKKAKAPAKPRTTAASAKTTAAKPQATAVSAVKTTAKKTTDGKPETAKTPSREAIAQLAHRYWKECGGQNGHDQQDWLRAERDLKSR